MTVEDGQPWAAESQAAPTAAPPVAERACSRRDAAVEDEVFHCGYFADVVFKFRTTSGEVEEVYGQRALFALLSPTLRRQLFPALGAGGAAATTSREDVWLDGPVTARAFREVARYVYKLPQQLTGEALPEVVAAARFLGLLELEELIVAWGMEGLAAAATESAPAIDAGGVEEGGSGLDDALQCLEALCVAPTAELPAPCDCGGANAAAWREALLRNHQAAEVFASPAFISLSPAALQELLQAESLRADPEALWRASLAWAYASAQHSPQEVQGAVARSPKPRKLFGVATRLAESLAPAPPPVEQVEWQRRLTPVVEAIRFSQMTPAAFANHVEALDPMLPELRQAIYASRRRCTRGGEDGGPEPSNPL
mmetsp:Transcript_129661/g.276600  ORF Transcript_129661/g.276600 Transcript_129661/m.276600 type:complete len:370 (-) Transcript_129661:83-1192(-)